MHRLFYLLEMPLDRALKMAPMTCEELEQYESQAYSLPQSQSGAFWFPRWGTRVFDFSALFFAGESRQQAFLAAMESSSHPFFSEKETQLRFQDISPRMAGPAALHAAIRFYRQEVERMYQEFDFDSYIAHLKKRCRQWESGQIPEMDMTVPNLVQLADPEYEFIDLIRLMKTDWRSTALVFCRE